MVLNATDMVIVMDMDVANEGKINRFQLALLLVVCLDRGQGISYKHKWNETKPVERIDKPIRKLLGEDEE